MVQAGRHLGQEDWIPQRQDDTSTVWERFAATTELSRPSTGLRRGYALGDAAKKVRDKLRLHAEGHLPARIPADIEADHVAPTMRVEEARSALDTVLASACTRIVDWYDPEHAGPCPQIGIRATVGLGKSTASRKHLLELRQRRINAGAPSRIAVFTPSHALAEETAADWRQIGLSVSVLSCAVMMIRQMSSRARSWTRGGASG